MGYGCRAYYALNNLDGSCSKMDQRLTNDVDLLFQYLSEFYLGGHGEREGACSYYTVLKLAGNYCNSIFHILAVQSDCTSTFKSVLGTFE